MKSRPRTTREAFQEGRMNSQRLAAIMTIVGLSFSSAAVAGEKETTRPAALPALYVALGATQTWDIYSTSAALRAGAKESNPGAAPFARNAGSMSVSRPQQRRAQFSSPSGYGGRIEPARL